MLSEQDIQDIATEQKTTISVKKISIMNSGNIEYCRIPYLGNTEKYHNEKSILFCLKFTIFSPLHNFEINL